MTIGISQLPMKDIEAYLSIISKFTKGDEKSVDTKYVDGIDSSLIAIAATNDEGELILDRETIQNALQLNGIDADKYLLKDDSKTLLSDTYAVSTIISDEIKAIRDELYQTKAELAKLGLISQGDVYNGFYDAFKNNNIRYNNKTITTLAQANNEVGAISTITVNDTSDLIEGEYIVIKTTNETQVTKISSINNNRVELSPAVSGPLGADTLILKTAGIYNRGAFVFGEKTDAYASADVYKVIIKDGKQRQIIKTLNSSFTGFASKCTNMYSLDGALQKIQVSLACDGNPGVIRASLYKYIDENNYELIDKSNTISAAQVTGVLNNYSFEFDNIIKINRDETYIVLLTTEYANDSNRWYIGGFTDECLDNCACCADDTYDYISELFQLTNEMTDMYIAFYMSEIIENEVTYMQRGLYTCNMEIPNKFSRVRTELRIGREGLFTASDNAKLIYNESNPLQLDGNEYSYATLFTPGQQIVGGTSIGKVGSIVNSNNRFTLSDDTYISSGSDVYRVGYKVMAIFKNKTIDLTDSANPIHYSPTKIVELPLVSVMKGKEPGREDSSSDRLIFEYEIGKKDDDSIISLDNYDMLEIQIYWENNAVPAITLNNNPLLVGKLYDLTISTDRSYNKNI